MWHNELTPFGKWLRKKLVEIDKTHTWLAEQMNIERGVISQIVRGRRKSPDKEEAIKAFFENYQASKR